ISGGIDNVADGYGSVVPGGYLNHAGGDTSFAAGSRAKAVHSGAFVWADSSQISDFASTGGDQFLIRAAGGVGIGLTNPAAALHVASASSAPEFQISQQNSSDYTRLRMKVGGFQFW